MAFNWFQRKGQSVSPSRRGTAFMEVLESRQLMSASAFAALDVSNDTATAISLGTINKGKVAKTETIGAADDTSDYYTFTVTEKTTLSIKLQAKGKIAKQVQPILSLTNTLGTSAATKSPKALKHIVSPGTYYVAVTGLPEGGEAGLNYKLNVVTKAAAAKKAATFEDQPTNNGDGANGGTFTGTLVNAFTNPAPNAAVHQWEYVATTTGTFELPVTFSADTSWSAVAFDNATELTGGAGLGPGDGTLTVTTTAGQKYVFSILYGGQTSTNYSITFDSSFSQLKRSNITQ